MRLGMIGLGRMGMNMARRLLRDGHEVVAYNRSPDKVARIAAEGARRCGKHRRPGRQAHPTQDRLAHAARRRRSR